MSETVREMGVNQFAVEVAARLNGSGRSTSVCLANMVRSRRLFISGHEYTIAFSGAESKRPRVYVNGSTVSRFVIAEKAVNVTVAFLMTHIDRLLESEADPIGTRK